MTSSATAPVSSKGSPISERRVACAGRGIQRVAWRAAAVVFLLGIAGPEATAQKRYPIFTLKDLVHTMTTMGRNVEAVNMSIASSDFATAKGQLTRARVQLAISMTFWRDNGKHDAIRMLRETLTRMDDLDAALSRDKVDAAAVGALARQVDTACQSCHAVYRDQDPTTKAYRLKPGSV